MKSKMKILILTVLAALTLSGCMRTVDQMYCLPKRSDDYNDLQSVIDGAMTGLEYCAPLAGENQQAVQQADLNGDAVPEYLLYAKGTSVLPLRILIFQKMENDYVHIQSIESNGTSFDQVEYVQMDDNPGMEIVVGSQLTDQLLRSVSVYSFRQDMEAELLVSVKYTKFMTVDLNADQRSELFVLRPGQSETDNGIAELYGIQNGVVERSNEASMSKPADRLKRILYGKLYGGEPAVYVASTVDETAIITDVYAFTDGKLSNVSFSNESGTSVQTMRNYYVYADDIDSDGVVELPSLLHMRNQPDAPVTERHDLIRWYAMTATGEEVDKVYTYHNFVGGWYLELDRKWASRLYVQYQDSQYEFFIWNEDFTHSEKIMTLFVLSGQSREMQSETEERFVLYKSDTVVYAASLEPAADAYGITQQSIMVGFHLIQQDWKTGET